MLAAGCQRVFGDSIWPASLFGECCHGGAIRVVRGSGGFCASVCSVLVQIIRVSSDAAHHKEGPYW